MIVERELEIEAFKAREYWSIEADTSKDQHPFSAKLTHVQGDKLSQFSITDETSAQAAEATLLAAGTDGLQVVKVEKKQRRRNPGPALHHLHPAAGGVAQARLYHPAHNAHRPAALRRC